MGFALLLADQQPTVEDTLPAVWTAVGILAFAVLCFLIVKWIKKRMRQSDASGGTGFTLGDLRRLLKEVKMAQEEFDRAKANILEAHKRAMEVKPAQPTIVPKIEDRG